MIQMGLANPLLCRVVHVMNPKFHSMTPTKIVSQSQPLLTYLLATWPEVKRTKVKQWLKFGAVHVNDQSVTRQ